MLKEKEVIIGKTIMLFDGIIITIAFLFAYFLRQNSNILARWNFFTSRDISKTTYVPLADYLFIFICVVLLWCLMLYMNGMYTSFRTRKYYEILWILLKTSFIVGLTFGSLVFLLKLTIVSRMFFFIFFTVGFLFILTEKTFLYFISHSVRRRGLNFRSLLIIGTGPRAVNFIKKVKSHPEWGFNILGAVDDEPGRGVQKVGSADVIGSLDDIPDILRDYSVDEVIIMVPRSRLNYMQGAIYACETLGISATLAVDLFDLNIARAYVSEIDGIPLVRFRTIVAGEWSLFIKTIFDIVLSGLILIPMLPILCLAALSIKLTSKGPIFFKQERLGLNGRKFILYKFRTMFQGANLELNDCEDVEAMNGIEFKSKKQQWITPVGKLLRKLSIDEFPQLINVFLGQMSLIGPRPTVFSEVTQYSDWQMRRFSMKPGLTCLWQIQGRNKLSHEEWMKLDLEYLDTWSLWLDFKISIKTIRVVLLGTGAY